MTAPWRAGLAFTCKLKCPLSPSWGREALEKQRAEGLHRRLVGFTWTSEYCWAWGPREWGAAVQAVGRLLLGSACPCRPGTVSPERTRSPQQEGDWDPGAGLGLAGRL